MQTRLILTLLLLNFFFNVQSQNIDTLINEIEYSIIEDTSSTTTLYTFTIKNKSKNIFRTEPFGLNLNKILVHNSIGQKVSFDFIICGGYEQVIIESDSSYSWKSELIKIIPDNHPFISSMKIDRLDSMYMVYWMINKNTIGPIKYYLEKDLVTNLYNSDNLIRDRSAKMLRTLFDKKLTVVKEGHSLEYSLAYWKKMYSALKKGISVKDINRETNLSLERECAGGRFPNAKIQLDNSYHLTIEFDETNRLKKYDIFYKPKMVYFGRSKTIFGDSYTYYINGQFSQKESYVNSQLHGKQFFFHQKGHLIGKNIFDKGRCIEQLKYNSDGKLQRKIVYLEKGKHHWHGDRKVILYDKDGKVISQKIIKRRKKRKRKYK